MHHEVFSDEFMAQFENTPPLILDLLSLYDPNLSEIDNINLVVNNATLMFTNTNDNNKIL